MCVCVCVCVTLCASCCCVVVVVLRLQLTVHEYVHEHEHEHERFGNITHTMHTTSYAQILYSGMENTAALVHPRSHHITAHPPSTSYLSRFRSIRFPYTARTNTLLRIVYLRCYCFAVFTLFLSRLFFSRVRVRLPVVNIVIVFCS